MFSGVTVASLRGSTVTPTLVPPVLTSTAFRRVLRPGGRLIRSLPFTATLTPDGRTLIKWRTGYEVDNVGFRVYREQNGRRVRITSSIVPGTALIGAGPGASAGGRIYTWSDGTAPSEGVRYWLEDIDLKGKHTWHGPIVPAPASPRVPQQ